MSDQARKELLDESFDEDSSIQSGDFIIQVVADHSFSLISFPIILILISSLLLKILFSIRSYSLFTSNSRFVYFKSNKIDFEIHDLTESSKFIRVDIEAEDVESLSLYGSSNICMYKNHKLIQNLDVHFSFNNSIQSNLLYMKYINFDTLTLNLTVTKQQIIDKSQLFKISVTLLNRFLNNLLVKLHFSCILFSFLSLCGFVLLHMEDYSIEQKETITLLLSNIINNIIIYFDFNFICRIASYLIFYLTYLSLILLILKAKMFLSILILFINCLSLSLSNFFVYQTNQFLNSISLIIVLTLFIVSVLPTIACFISAFTFRYQHKLFLYLFLYIFYIISFFVIGLLQNLTLITNSNSFIPCIFLITPFLDTFSSFIFTSLHLSSSSTYSQL